MTISVSVELIEIAPTWCDIFNHPNFYKLHRTENSHYLSFLCDNKLIGVCHFTEIEPGVFRSPYKGTYGDISFKNSVDRKSIECCIEKLTNYLKYINATSISLVSPPFAHNLNFSTLLFNTYLNSGFLLVKQEINHSIVIDENDLSFKMMNNNKKRLRKCQKEDFIFESVTDQKQIAEVYETIRLNRVSKGYPVTMTLAEILLMYKVFPDKLFFFKTTHYNKCIASSICIKVSDNVLYVFYWGNLPGYEQYSPIVIHASCIYDFAKRNNFKILDAGISSYNGVPNYGLVKFKENLGFSASPKITYRKVL